MIYVIATVIVKTEHRADFLENARTVIAATVKEPGCISYDLTSSITEPNCFVFVERWTTREAVAAHFETPHLKQWLEIAVPITDKRVIEIIHADTVETQ